MSDYIATSKTETTMRIISLVIAMLFALGSIVPLFMATGQSGGARWMYPTPPVTSTREVAISNTQEIERLRTEVDELRHQLTGEGRGSLGDMAVRMATLETMMANEIGVRHEQWATEQRVFFGIAGAIALAVFERLLPRLRRTVANKRKEDEDGGD